jgi:predicted DNA-binding transcriptional regulator AlpA
MSTDNNRAENVADTLLFDNRIEKNFRYLTSSELASVLGLSVHTIRSWRKFRIITPIKFGRSVRWLLKEVLEELSNRRLSHEKS